MSVTHVKLQKIDRCPPTSFRRESCSLMGAKVPVHTRVALATDNAGDMVIEEH